jgi:hypothetical protein
MERWGTLSWGPPTLGARLSHFILFYLNKLTLKTNQKPKKEKIWEEYQRRSLSEQNKGTFLEQAVKGSEILSFDCSAF